MKQFIICLLIVSTGNTLWGQNTHCNLTISGTVIDTLDNNPLAQTKIVLLGEKNKSAISDQYGKFKIEQICPGEVELHVSHLNCEHVHIKFAINSDTTLTIYIRHTETTFPDAKKTAVKQKSDMSELSKERIESARLNGLGGLFSELSGVSLLKTGNSIAKPLVNGLHSNRVLIINNGIRQEGQNWGMEHAPEIDPFLAAEVILLKGANGLRYGGDGIGGVLLLNPPSLFREKEHIVQGEFNLAGFSNGRGGIVSGIAGYKFSEKIPLYMRLQGTYKRSGNSKTPDYYLNNTGNEEYNYSANLGYSRSSIRTELFYSEFNTKIGIFSGSHIGNLNDLQIAMSSARPLSPDVFSYAIDRPYQKVMHRLLKSRTNWYKDPFNSFELNLSYQVNHREEYDPLRSSTSSKVPAFDYWIKTSMMDLQWRRLDLFGFTMQLGLQAIHQANAYQGRFFVPGFYQNGLGQYLILEKRSGKHNLEFALRNDNRMYEFYLWNNGIMTIDKRYYQGFSAIIREQYESQRLGRIGFNLSSTFRPASANELYSNGLHQGIAAIEIGDPNIKQERAYALSVDNIFESKSIILETELTYKYISGFINLIPGKEPVLTIRGAFPTFNYIQQDAMIYGLNFNLRYKLHKSLELRLKSELLNGYDLKQKTCLNQMPPYVSSCALNYNRGKFKFNIESAYTFKQWRYIEQSDYMPPPPAFLLFNTEIKHEFNIGKQAITISFQINNLLNKRYREYLNRFRYYADAQGRNMTLNIQIPLKVKTTK